MADADPPVIANEDELPRRYNAATYFIDRHLGEGRGDKPAFIDDRGRYTYRDLVEQVNRAANGLRNLGIRPEARVAMVMLDGIDFPALFWGAIKAGIVPVPINTLLAPHHYRYILQDCRAQALIVSEALYETVSPALDDRHTLEHVIVAGNDGHGAPRLADLLAEAATTFEPADTTRDDVAFWLYSSGSTGNPKGVRHRHANLHWTARLYGRGPLGIGPDDVVYSAAKLFFAYGLGNAMTFPLDVGATAVLLAGRPTPDAVMAVLQRHQPTVFCGVPTLYAALLADAANDRAHGSARLRCCISAGEALPEDVAKRWEERFGVQILDGVGSTEMLHIYLSNRPGDVRYGTSGTMVPGYSGRLVDEHDAEVATGVLGELLVSGPSAAEGYWNQRTKTLNTFVGRWMRTGDKYIRDEAGYYHYCGRADDMFKSGGNWVSPFEVESALIGHDQVLEAAVIPHADADGNFKPKAYVVLQPGVDGSDALATALQERVKSAIELWKYPRWIEFTDALPKTATGKIQRFKLRELDQQK